MTLFLPEARSQHCPGREGYERFDVMIASPELPCGVAWLASCLFELGVPLWKPWGINDREHWRLLDARRWRYECPGSGWSRLIPGFVDGREVTLRRQPVPQFTHAWPGQLPLAEKLILFVRDPRDSLLSDWQRRRRHDPNSQQGLGQYLAEPTPGLNIPPRVWLGLYMAAWAAASKLRPTLIVRFEDAKLDPRAVLGRVLKFVDLRVLARAQRAAVDASTHRKVAEAETRLLAKGVVSSRLLGFGIPFAHRNRTNEDRVQLDRRLATTAQSCGYEDAHAEVEDEMKVDTMDSLRKALLPGSADPDLLDHCLRIAVSDR
jgi:hypothetical protein